MGNFSFRFVLIFFETKVIQFFVFYWLKTLYIFTHEDWLAESEHMRHECDAILERLDFRLRTVDHFYLPAGRLSYSVKYVLECCAAESHKHEFSSQHALNRLIILYKIEHQLNLLIAIDFLLNRKLYTHCFL